MTKLLLFSKNLPFFNQNLPDMPQQEVKELKNDDNVLLLPPQNEAEDDFLDQLDILEQKLDCLLIILTEINQQFQYT